MKTASPEWPSVTGVPSQMSAMMFREVGAPATLAMETVPTPTVGPGEVLVRVAAVTLSRLVDIVTRHGAFPGHELAFPHTLGGEHAGVVAALGDGVADIAVGDRVAVFPCYVDRDDEYTRAGRSDLSPNLKLIGVHRPGAYAQYVAVPATCVTRVPDGVDPVAASAIALSGPVAMNQFLQVGGVGDGSRVLVQGAGSGLGVTTALLARHLGAEVIVATPRTEQLDGLNGLGFEHALDSGAPDFVDSVRRVHSDGVDVVVHNMGLPRAWEAGMRVLRPGGAMVSSGMVAGQNMSVDLKRLYGSGLRLIGVRAGTAASTARLWHEVEEGFRGAVGQTWNLSEAASAQFRLEEGNHPVGKIVLTVD